MENENKTMFAKAISANQSFGWSSIFRGVTQKHSRDDLDHQFAAGIRGHIPASDQLLEHWQKPWMFSRFLMYGVFIWVAIAIWLKAGMVDGALIGSLFLTPTAVVPISLLLFFWELNIPRNVPIYTIFKMFIFGGVGTSFVFNIVHAILDNSNVPQDQFGYWFLVGVVEEITKLVLVAIALRKTEYCWGLNGLAIGAAVGCGFDVFENIGYFFSTPSLDLLTIRGITSINGHLAWAAMYGAALALAKGKQKLSGKHFLDSTFLITFFVAILLHGSFDYFEIFVEKYLKDNPLYRFIYLTNEAPLLNYIVFTIIFAIPTYALILWLVRKSVRQVVVYASNSANSHANQVMASDYANTPVNTPVNAPVNGYYPPAGNINPTSNYEPVPASRELVLRCVSGELAGHSYRIGKGLTFTIGRGSKNNIQFADDSKGVSRVHCNVFFDGTNAYVTDLASTHGTFLADGRRMQPNLKYSFNSGESFYIASAKNTFTVTIQ